MKLTCIIPYHNEGERIFKVLDVVTKLHNVDQIICIDDGSTDNTSKLVKKKYPQVQVHILNKNHGKGGAIQQGIILAKHDNLLLLDADLINLIYEELQDGINTYIKNTDIDMIVFRRILEHWNIKILRHDVLMSGQRIMKRKDLLIILNTHPTTYQLEVAMNKYALDHDKNCKWMPLSIINTSKLAKWGRRKGTEKSMQMMHDFVSYAGFWSYFKQVLFFCKESAT